MQASTLKAAERNATDLIEEAIALLRLASSRLFLAYYTGAIPFWLAILYFVSDMSRDAYAESHLAEESLLVALAYVWMRCWHAGFGISLRALLQTESPVPWTFRRVVSMTATQTFLQPFGLLVRSLASLLIIPYLWAAVFFQNAALEEEVDPEGRSISSRAWASAKLWPGQAHSAALMLTVFGLFIWLNIFAVLGSAPHWLKLVFGIDSAAERAHSAYIWNYTFLTAVTAITLMLTDPVWKAICVLRCFYAQSLVTGADLRLRLREVSRRARQGAKYALLVFVFLTFTCALPHAGAAPEAEAAPAAVQPRVAAPHELDRALEDVLSRREFTWRAPREAAPESDDEDVAPEAKPSYLSKITKFIRTFLGKVFGKIWEWTSRFFTWLFGNSSNQTHAQANGAGFNYQYLLYGAGAAALVLLGWALARWKRVGGKAGSFTATAVERPDLEAGDIAADLLPEDEWLRFSRELAARGEFRLALRAAYLAGIAHLGERDLLTIAKYKSNREYSRELARRARNRAEMLAAFQENLRAFERVWYGEHPADRGAVSEFEQNLLRIRGC